MRLTVRGCAQCPTLKLLPDTGANIKKNAAACKNFERMLGRHDFSCDTSGLYIRPVRGEGEEYKVYKRGYLKKQIANRREGPPDIEEIKRRRSKKKKGEKRPARVRGGGFRRIWVSLDEAAICENHVSNKTLHRRGRKINRRDGQGKRLCMGIAGMYFSERANSHKPQAMTLDFFMFSASGGQVGRTRKGSGPSNAELKADIKRLMKGKPVPGGMPTTKEPLVKLYKELTDKVMCDDETADLLAQTEESEQLSSDLAASTVPAHQKWGEVTIDQYDYHGNFTAERFELWFDKICQKVLCFYHKVEFGEYIEDWGADGDLEPIPEDADDAPQINMDGAKYHLRCTNPSPTKSWNRQPMIDWLDAEHAGTLSAKDKTPWTSNGSGGLSRKEIFKIIEPLKPKKNYAVYDIAKKYGIKVGVFQCPLPFLLVFLARELLRSGGCCIPPTGSPGGCHSGVHCPLCPCGDSMGEHQEPHRAQADEEHG